jgi:hypothetical protein
MQSKKKKGRPTEENSIGNILDRLQIHDDETRRFIRDLAGKKYGIFPKSIYSKKSRIVKYEYNINSDNQTKYKGFDPENLKRAETITLNAILLKDLSFSNREIVKLIKENLSRDFYQKWVLQIEQYQIKIKYYSEIYEKVNHNLQEKECIGFNPQEESLENLIFINSSKINNITLKSNLDNKTIIQNFHSLTMIEKLENKMKESGEDTDSLSKLAFNYLRLKEFDIVRQLTKRVFEINAEHPYASYIMALLYLNESRSKINEANNYKIMSDNVKSLSTEASLKADEQDSLSDAEYLRKNALDYILYSYNGWARESGSYIDFQTREQVILVLVDLVYVEVIKKITLKNIQTNEFTFKQIKIISKFIEKEILTDTFFSLKVNILEFKLKVLTLIFYFKRSHYESFGKMYFDDFSKHYFKIIFPFLDYNRFIKNQSTEINLYSIQDVFFFHFNILFNLNDAPVQMKAEF